MSEESLVKAIRWHRAANQAAILQGRLATKYWDELPWDGVLDRDEKFKALDRETLQSDASLCLELLDDQSVVILFAAFEATVRDRVKIDVERRWPEPDHPILKDTRNSLVERIERGNFSGVLDAFKSVDHDLVEQVKQVREYRNWVAHGRRSEQPSRVNPEEAFKRLDRFLQTVLASTAERFPLE